MNILSILNHNDPNSSFDTYIIGTEGNEQLQVQYIQQEGSEQLRKEHSSSVSVEHFIELIQKQTDSKHVQIIVNKIQSKLSLQEEKQNIWKRIHDAAQECLIRLTTTQQAIDFKNINSEQEQLIKKEEDKKQFLNLWQIYGQKNSLEAQLEVLEVDLNLQSVNDPEIAIELETRKKKKQFLERLIELKNNGQPIQLEERVRIIEANFSVDQPSPNAAPVPINHLQTDSSLPSFRRFYQEKQREGTGTCGVHALNTFLGMPLFTIEEVNNFVLNKLRPILCMQEEELQSLCNIESDGGVDWEDIFQLLYNKGFECTVESKRREHWLNGNWEEDLLLKRIESQDRIMINKGMHLVTLRKNKEIGKWFEINSLQCSTEKMYVCDSIRAFIRCKTQEKDNDLIHIVF